MIKVFIVVSGGVIQSVTVDHDNIDAGDDVPTMDSFVHEDFILSESEMEEYLLNETK
jgi:hypothetical protein